MSFILKNIPNIITLANLWLGCIITAFVFNGQMYLGAILVSVCVILDFMDGFAARTLKVSSQLGVQLDSLADLISFGVVPGAFVFKMLEERNILNGDTGFELLPYAGFLITVFSALRLAKFNLRVPNHKYFLGLPTPANAIFVVSFFVINHIHPNHYLSETLTTRVFLTCVILFSCIMMNIDIKLFSLKFKSLKWKKNEIRYIFLFLALVLVLLFQFWAIPFIIILYILMSIIFSYIVMTQWLD